MNATFPLTVSTPDGDVFKKNAVMLSLRGSEGDLAILAGHVPFVTTVRAGACKIVRPDGSIVTGQINGGLLTVARDFVSLLVGSFKEEK